jgi:hypothetical protein
MNKLRHNEQKSYMVTERVKLWLVVMVKTNKKLNKKR